MEKCDQQRRNLLIYGGTLAGLSLFGQPAWCSLTTTRPKILTLNNLNTGETLKAEFFDGRRYIKSELKRLNHLFRDYRNNLVKPIDPTLFEQLYHLQLMLKTHKPVQLISGYRSQATNSALRSRSPHSGVAENSYHTRGKAMDFHIEGVALRNIHKAALTMRAGGVGYYPRSNFVHIDTGPVRHW